MSYVELFKTGKLNKIRDELLSHLSSCDLCPLNCGVNRIKNEKGLCKTGRYAAVSSYMRHHGEERPISGHKGSGTIFFTHCNLKCEFCQNYDISQLGYGEEYLPETIAGMMVKLQKSGCHNINFVSPTHVVAQIVESLSIASESGLNIPLVYNSGGYDAVKTLKIIDGIFDIYMPDMKYGSDETGLLYSKVKNYSQINQKAIPEMYRQTGNLKINKKGTAVKGLLIRHLVLPENKADTDKIASFLSDNVSKDIYINIMNQYHPIYNSKKYMDLSRRITFKEYDEAVQMAKNAGLYKFDKI